MITFLAAVIKWIVVLSLFLIERDKTKKENLKQAKKELASGIKTRNAAKITAAWDKVRRVRK